MATGDLGLRLGIISIPSPASGEGQDGGLRAATNRARHLRSNPTDAERILWRHLRLRQVGGHKFRRQRPIGPYFVDFVCLEKHIVVEVDGGQHSEQRTYDDRRDAWLTKEGFHVLRFWDHEVLREIEHVKQVIWQALSAPSSILPRSGGEEH
jgi:very-short-patch-repair endonuclease